MNSLRLGLREDRRNFTPGGLIQGAVDWEEPNAPTSAEVRLGWFTAGKGSEDHFIVKTHPLEAPQPTDLRQFSFTAPPAPYSFSGKLVSLIWAVELVLQPGDRCERCEIVIAPEGKEVLLAGVSAG